MATDFNKNAISAAGGLKPSASDTPLDIRTRVETEADIITIPRPYLGMVVYVKDTGKRYEITALKDGKSGLTTIKNGFVKEYRELLVSYDDLLNKPEIPSIEGLATEEMVMNNLITKLDKEEGKSLVADTEIERLSQVYNYDDLELRNIINDKANKNELFSGNYEDLNNLPEIPSIEGLATEEYVCNSLENKLDKEEDKSLVPNNEIEKLAGIEENANNYVLPSASSDTLGGIKVGSNLQMTSEGLLNGANYQFKINMVEYSNEPSVEIQGDFPNLTVIFNLPYILPEKENTGRMWYGWIPTSEEPQDGKVSDALQLGEAMDYQVIKLGINYGSLIEADPEPIGKVSIQVEQHGFLCVIIPEDSNLVVYADNGIGSKILFSEMDPESGLAKDGCKLTNSIDGINYIMYGLYETLGGGSYSIYIEEK